MRVVAWEAELATPDNDGTPLRAYLEASAKRGDQLARAKLTPPPTPHAVSYLSEWFRELSIARGEGLSGPAPITYLHIDAWARLTDRRPAPHEVRALIALDHVWRHPTAFNAASRN